MNFRSICEWGINLTDKKIHCKSPLINCKILIGQLSVAKTKFEIRIIYVIKFDGFDFLDFFDGQ